MKTYRITDHIADVRMFIEASSFEELLEAGLEGMSSILKKDFCGKIVYNEITLNVEFHYSDKTSLLIDFLSDVLTMSHIHNAVFCSIDFESLNEDFMRCKVYGKRVDSFEKDVKAVSYHEAEVTTGSIGLLQTYIIFDI